MTAAFSSALSKLDDSLRSVRSHLDCMQSALEINEDQLNSSLADAVRQAEILRGLIRAERPDANWRDRENLDQLIHAVADGSSSDAHPVSAF